MLAVIFEVDIEEVCKDEYLKIASMKTSSFDK